ncbi:MAG: hypothetical protein IAG10_19095, partial [Planctomycetaceae bacterium]|nr:hypothetical protein [Planctomycetaceae bacterium]
NPWSCRLDRLSLRPMVEAQGSQTSSRPAGLSDQHLEVIARAALRMETEFADQPVDLEWSCASDCIVFFQVRPLPLASSRESDRSDSTFESCERSRLRALAEAGRPLWVRHQLAESLPHPTPLSWSVWEQFMSPDGGLGVLYRRLGFAPRRFADGHGFLQLIAGRVYADPDRLPQMICSSFPLRHSHQRLIESAEELHDPPTEFDPERLDPWFLLKLPHLAWVMVRSTGRIQRLRRTAGQHFREFVVPEFFASLATQSAIDCRRLTLRELVTRAEECRAWLFDEWLPQLMLPGWLGVQAWQAVTRGLMRVLSADEIQAVKIALLSRVSYPVHECDVPTTTAAGAALPFEGEFELATQSGEPLGSQSIVPDVLRHLPRDIANVELPDELRQIVSADRLRRLSRVIDGELKLVHRLLPLREIGKVCSRMGIEVLRHVIHELAARSERGERLFFHRWQELPSIADETTSGPASNVIDDRRAEWAFWRSRDVPQVLQAGHANPCLNSDTSESSQETGATETNSAVRRFAARSLSPGKAAGVVWHWPKAAGIEPPPGSVIVANAVDAPTVLHCTAAVAFIVEQGGLLSHAAVTARFVKRPMVVLDGVTSRLPAGAYAEVDGDTGAVTSSP